VSPCIVAVGYQRFRGPFCVHLQCEVASVRENGIELKGKEQE
jgi:hypothetical protein